MAYTVQMLTPGETGIRYVLEFTGLLKDELDAEGIFRADISAPMSSFKGMPARSPEPRWHVELRRVRLMTKKPYCGQHPGECQAIFPRKQMRASYLEWDDWVAFHSVINNLINKMEVRADAWSTPMDCKGKFWIRKDNKPRTRFDWDERSQGGGAFGPRIVRVWNQGTEDQFV